MKHEIRELIIFWKRVSLQEKYPEHIKQNAREIVEQLKLLIDKDPVTRERITEILVYKFLRWRDHARK